MTKEQRLKMKRQEYNRRYYQKKKQKEFIKAVKLIESCWNTVISRQDVNYYLNKEKSLRKMIIILSFFVILLSCGILFIH